MKTLKPYEAHPHTEARPDEVYLGNVTKDEFSHQVAWDTRRLGAVPLTPNREAIWGTPLHPLFVKRSEIEKRGFTIIEQGPNQ